MFDFCNGCGWLNARGDCVNHFALGFGVKEEDGSCAFKEKPKVNAEDFSVSMKPRSNVGTKK